MTKLLKISFVVLIIINPTIGNVKRLPLMDHWKKVDSWSREIEVTNKVIWFSLHSLLKKIKLLVLNVKFKENSFLILVGFQNTANIWLRHLLLLILSVKINTLLKIELRLLKNKEKTSFSEILWNWHQCQPLPLLRPMSEEVKKEISWTDWTIGETKSSTNSSTWTGWQLCSESATPLRLKQFIWKESLRASKN